MRPSTVRRFTASLFLTLLLAAIAFASAARWNVTPADEARPPAALDAPVLFNQYCGECHTAEELEPRIRLMDEKQRADLERFLQTHGEAPPEADRAILDSIHRRNTEETRKERN